MTPTHHPDPDDLMAYASGTAAEWSSLVVACHLTYCAECREDVALLDGVGGALIEELAAPGDAGQVSGAAISGQTPRPSAPKPSHGKRLAPELSVLPRPLHDYLAGDAPRFRFLVPGVQHVPLTFSVGGVPARVVRFAPGFTVPEHEHTGTEMVLVLDGELEDSVSGERFVNGDLSQREAGTEHAQRILGDGCIALVISVAPIRPKSLFGRILKAFAGV